jgi:hypothetical protein
MMDLFVTVMIARLLVAETFPQVLLPTQSVIDDKSIELH